MSKHMILRPLLAALIAASTLQGCIPLIAAGVGVGASSTFDRRTYAEQLMDREIEVKFNRSFPRELEARTSVTATSFNRWVLISGKAIDDSAKQEAEQIARNLPNVRQIFNEVSIGYPTAFGDRANDSYLTTKVKTRLIDSKFVSGHHVKVVSESGAVFLMGLVTENEAQAATEVARNTSGVQRVVSMFEIISDAKARERDALSKQSAN